MKTDLRNIQSAQEAYLSDSGYYSSSAAAFQASAGNVIVVNSADSSGYKVTVTNNSISSGNKTCHVAVGSKATSSATDGVIVCP